MADAATNIAIEQQADGSIVVDINTRRPQSTKPRESTHDENLAEVLDDQTLSVISSELMEGVEADIASRIDWVANYNDGLRLLGILLEKGGIDSKTSKVRHPLLMWAIVKFQAQTRGEVLPVGGPVDVDQSQQLSPTIADAIKEDTNYYFTTKASEYYPDTDRGLFYLGYGGTIFKKVYRCPIRKRPVSECVYLTDLIISNDTTDIPNAARITHRVEMTRQQMLQLIDAEYFRDLPIMTPSLNRSTTTTAVGQTIGVKASIQRPDDIPHTLYESYCLLDLGRHDESFREKGQTAGLQLPYRVTMDRDSRQIFEVRRNWREADETRAARRRFVKWGLVPGIGYLDLGYLNLLGNHALALTALERILIDSGIYSIWPGGVRVKGMRMETNEIRPGPGEFPEIDTSGMPIQQAIMALPFKGDSGTVLQLLQHLEMQGEKTAGQVDIPTGAGGSLQNVPVGTIMAAIDQQAQPEIAVHQRLHNAQKEEILLVQELLAEEDDCLALLKRPDASQPYTREQFARASLMPASDPNTPSRVHRVVQGTVLEALSAKNPTLYNQREVQKRLLGIAKIYNPEEVLMPVLPPQPAPPDPTMAIAQMQAELEQQRITIDKADKDAHLKLDQRAQMLKEWQTEQELALEKQKAQASAASDAQKAEQQAFVSQTDSQTRTATEQQRTLRDSEIELANAEANRGLERDNAEADRESRELIAAMNDQTKLEIEGLRQKAEKTSDNPARDKKSGP